jgi:hypothetical protein
MFEATDPMRSPTMTKDQGKPAFAAVQELLARSPDGLREIVRSVMQAMLLLRTIPSGLIGE